MRQIFHALAVLLLAAGASFAQLDWHTYEARTMADLIAITPPEGNPGLIVSANPFPSKTVLVYQGKKRPIEGYSRTFVDIWMESRNITGERKNFLLEEYLFKENGGEFWMPVLKKISPFVDAELKAGDQIMGYYFFLGGYNPKTLYEKDTTKNKGVFSGKDEIRWVFAFEEYDNPVPAKSLKIDGYLIQPFTAAIDKKIERNVTTGKIFFHPQQTRSRSAVIYTGQTRTAGKSKFDFLDGWGEGYQLIGASALLSQEALFRMNGKDHWLPVRKTVLETMQKQVKSGDSILIDTICAGGIPNEQTFDWVFIVGNFSINK